MARSPRPRSREPVDGDPFDAALDHVRANRHADALAALVVAWRKHPGPRLGEVIATLTLRARTVLPEVRGKSAAAVAAWERRARDATAADVPALLESLCDVPARLARDRLVYVESWLPDPRVDEWLALLFETIPYRATSTQSFWTRVFALARRMTDTQQIDRVAAADLSGVASTMRTWMQARLGKLVDHLTARRREVVEPGIVDELAGLFGPRRISIGTQNLSALLHAVYDAPDDDAPRAVYGDALLERGDPRGELISIQLQLAADPTGEHRELRRREKELLATHRRRWLGALAPILAPRWIRFERGFLASCMVYTKRRDRLRKLAGHPAWSTVHTLHGPMIIALHPVMRSLRTLHYGSFWEYNDDEDPARWRELLLGAERPIEELHYRGIHSDVHWERALENNESLDPGLHRIVRMPHADELAALCSCSALPKLRTLTIEAEPWPIIGPILESQVIRRLHTLRFAFERADETPFLRGFEELLATAPVPVLAFALSVNTIYEWPVVLERGERGYERASIELGSINSMHASASLNAALADMAVDLVDMLPPTLRELRVTARRYVDATNVTRLRTALAQRARRRSLDVCELSHVGH